jgi:hypothetical protein
LHPLRSFASFFGKALLLSATGKGPDVHPIKPRNEEQLRWLAETADALACAERLATQLIELRGTRDIESVLVIQAEIAVLRRRIGQLEWESGDRREYHPDWMKSSAWSSHGA